MFGAGYVLGTKAGRERYAQIVTVAGTASKRLEEYSARHRAHAGDVTDEPDRGSRRRQAAL
jgi:hypothetical protein